MINWLFLTQRIDALRADGLRQEAWDEIEFLFIAAQVGGKFLREVGA